MSSWSLKLNDFVPLLPKPLSIPSSPSTYITYSRKVSMKPIKKKTGRPLLGKERRVLLTVSIDPSTAAYIKRNASKYGSRGSVVDHALAKLVRKEKK
jgi:hypothetical protein